jgi:hypothetical protein
MCFMKGIGFVTNDSRPNLHIITNGIMVFWIVKPLKTYELSLPANMHILKFCKLEK